MFRTLTEEPFQVALLKHQSVCVSEATNDGAKWHHFVQDFPHLRHVCDGELARVAEELEVPPDLLQFAPSSRERGELTTGTGSIQHSH